MNNENLMIENARIIFRNFSGKEGKFNREGERSFGVILDDPAVYDAAINGGYNVKPLKPREEGDEPAHYISVNVKYGAIPPKVYLITRGAKTLLDEDTVGSLDYADIAHADLIIRPYNWSVNGKSGVKGYLKTAYITLEEDDFAYKYDAPVDDNGHLPF